MHRRPLVLASLALALGRVRLRGRRCHRRSRRRPSVTSAGCRRTSVAATSAPPDAAVESHGAGEHDGDHRRVDRRPHVVAGSDRRRSGPVGRLVDGNRLLVIGDSIMASTTERYGGAMCSRLVPMGWAVEIDAESGQHIEFAARGAARAAGRRLGRRRDHARQQLRRRSAGVRRRPHRDRSTTSRPGPVVLLTVTEFARGPGRGQLRRPRRWPRSATTCAWSSGPSARRRRPRWRLVSATACTSPTPAGRSW